MKNKLTSFKNIYSLFFFNLQIVYTKNTTINLTTISKKKKCIKLINNLATTTK